MANKNAEYQRTWYLKNKAKQVAKARTTRIKNRAFVASLKNKPCTDCGVAYPPYVMDWDHRESTEKRYGVAYAAWSRGQKTILEEIKKCDLVCANCHRERTHQRRLQDNIGQ
jgi:hypothetical protein